MGGEGRGVRGSEGDIDQEDKDGEERKAGKADLRKRMSKEKKT